MPDPLDAFLMGCASNHQKASELNFPPFTTGLRQESPLNSAPYLFGMRDFLSRFASSDRRREIADSLLGKLSHFESNGMSWHFLLIGGSFLRFDREPADLDGLLVYTIDLGAEENAARILKTFAERGKSSLVDLKLCPADCGPAILAKRSIFFSNLFSFDRSTNLLARGTIMVVPDRGSRDPAADQRATS